MYGNIGQYQEETECFTDYIDRFDAFLLANGIQDDRKSSLFLATIGPESYKLLFVSLLNLKIKLMLS